MGRPITQEDIDVIAETFKDMEHLSTRQKILVFLPGVIITSMDIISILSRYNSSGSLAQFQRHIPLKQGEG